MTDINTLLKMVERFQKDIIGLPIPNKPMLLSYERMGFRLGHLQEELNEITEADIDKNLAEVADGLIDLTYIALGTLIEMGITPGPVFEEVHKANMAKERGSISKRPDSAGYDAIKPEGWTAPDILPFLNVTRKQIIKLAAKNYINWHGPSIPNFLVIGHGRHGKDTTCEILAEDFGFKFQSSSMFCAEQIMIPAFEKIGKPYDTMFDCYTDRHTNNNRQIWYDTIRKYNTPDLSRLAKEILKENNVYCGMRHADEMVACVKEDLFDYIIWVDRSEHERPEDMESCSVTKSMADYVLDNNGSIEDLKRQIFLMLGKL